MAFFPEPGLEKTSKKQFKILTADFKEKALNLQKILLRNKKGVAIILCGLEGSGRNHFAAKLNSWFDPASLNVFGFFIDSQEEKERPLDWRYWQNLPSKGEINIYFSGWYGKLLLELAEKGEHTSESEKLCHDIQTLEKLLTDDGMVVIKLWLNISKSKYRIAQISAPVSKPDILNEMFFRHQTFMLAAKEVIKATHQDEAPWQIIDSEDTRNRDLKAMLAIMKQCENSLENADKPLQHGKWQPPNSQNALGSLNLAKRVKKKAYKNELVAIQKKVNTLSWQAFQKKKSGLFVFEGWDAAGKGGAIRRIAACVDGRICRTIRYGAPTKEELAHHYLWRFWRETPRAGNVRLYDRSWYGRVLVERVEGFASDAEWQRSFGEINHFEKLHAQDNYVIRKFWIHISREEQLKRFQERKITATKKHKLTDEDWRNRDKWDSYVDAVEEMIPLTSTPYAPWVTIAGEQKEMARLSVLKEVANAYEHALDTK